MNTPRILIKVYYLACFKLVPATLFKKALKKILHTLSNTIKVLRK